MWRERVRFHLGMKQLIDAAPPRLGLIKRKVGALHQFVGVKAMIGRDRDADADAGVDDMIFHRWRMADDLDNAARKPFRRLRLGSALQDCELVAAEAGDGVVGAGAFSQARSDPAQQFVADRMAEAIVDSLEIIEVEAQHGHLPAMGCDLRQAVAHLVSEQHAVRKLGERIVLRHMRDARLGLAALSDVLVSDDPAALLHRAMRELDDAAVAEMAIKRVLSAFAELLDIVLVELLGVGGGVITDRAAVHNDVAHRHPRLYDFRRQSVHLNIALVADNDAQVTIEHHQALSHVVERRVEAAILLAQLVMRPLALGNVLLGADEAAVAQWTIADGQQSPVQHAALDLKVVVS
jgi:hypothetical protein